MNPNYDRLIVERLSTIKSHGVSLALHPDPTRRLRKLVLMPTVHIGGIPGPPVIFNFDRKQDTAGWLAGFIAGFKAGERSCT